MLLEQKELPVPEEELVITTEKLKEMIAELLKIEKEDVSLNKIVVTLLENTKEEKEKEKIEQKKLREREEYKRKRKEDDIRLPAGATLGDVDDIVAYYEADGKQSFLLIKCKDSIEKKDNKIKIKINNILLRCRKILHFF